MCAPFIFILATFLKEHLIILLSKRDKIWQVQTFLHWEIGKLDATFTRLWLDCNLLHSCHTFVIPTKISCHNKCAQHCANGVNELVKHVHGILMGFLHTREIVFNFYSRSWLIEIFSLFLYLVYILRTQLVVEF